MGLPIGQPSRASISGREGDCGEPSLKSCNPSHDENAARPDHERPIPLMSLLSLRYNDSCLAEVADGIFGKSINRLATTHHQPVVPRHWTTSGRITLRHVFPVVARLGIASRSPPNQTRKGPFELRRTTARPYSEALAISCHNSSDLSLHGHPINDVP